MWERIYLLSFNKIIKSNALLLVFVKILSKVILIHFHSTKMNKIMVIITFN